MAIDYLLAFLIVTAVGYVFFRVAIPLIGLALKLVIYLLAGSLILALIL